MQNYYEVKALKTKLVENQMLQGTHVIVSKNGQAIPAANTVNGTCFPIGEMQWWILQQKDKGQHKISSDQIKSALNAHIPSISSKH